VSDNDRSPDPGRAVKRAVTPKVVKKASRAMHLLPHRRVTGHDPQFMAKNRYVGFVALRTMIAVSGVLTAKAVTHPYHFQRPHRR
jgi:hypothetical protein